MRKVKKQIAKRIASLCLVLAMVLTLVNVGQVSSYAADSDMNVRLHFKNIYDWAEPAIQFWGGSHTEVSGIADTNGKEIPGWGVTGYSLKEAGDWYTIELKGDFTGFQFLDIQNPNNGNTGGKGYDANMQYCKGDEATDLYCVWGEATNYTPVWYCDEACAISIESLKPQDADKVLNETCAVCDGISYAFTYYGNNVYEVRVPVNAGISTIAVTSLGEYLGSTSVSVEAETDVIVRLQDGKLYDSVHDANKFMQGAAVTGDFTGIALHKGITNWNPADANGEMDYIGGGIYKKTLTFDALENPTSIQYKIAFNDSWDYSIGRDGGNVVVTLPTGATEYTIICNEITGEIYESTTEGFSTKTVSLIGTLRDHDEWNPSCMDYDFIQISDHTYLTQLTLEPGSYEYKVVYDHANWMDGGNRKVTVSDQKKVVTFIYDETRDDVLTSDVLEEKAEKVNYVFHFQNKDNWEKVYAYVKQGDNWDSVPGYGYIGGWPGAEVKADAANDGWYSFAITAEKGVKLNVIVTNGQGSQTETLTCTDMVASSEYWMTGLSAEEQSKTKPVNWNRSEAVAPVNPNADSRVKSPVVNADRTITFTVSDSLFGEDQDVRLMGTVGGTDWNDGLKMNYDASNQAYTVTTAVQAPGAYQYKFRSGNNWQQDPLNDKVMDGNSLVVVAGLTNASLEVKRGEETELPATLALYDERGNKTDTAVTYSLKEDNNNVVINGTKLLVKAGTSMTSLVLIAKAGDETSEVTVSIKDKLYTYHVYFHGTGAAHQIPENADLWAWENGGGNLGPVAFTESVTLDGQTWIKADLVTAATNIGLIPRSAGSWAWQTGNHYYNNANKAEEVSLYIVEGDDANTYTNVPEIKVARERYVMLEYDRANGDYDGWNIYTWNSGFGSEVSVGQTEINGKTYFIIPVKDSDKDLLLSFCMRRSEANEPWAEKDGNDHSVLVPADQLVVKAKFLQGKGVVSHQVYNTGVACKAAEGKIDFYYRDDAKFLQDVEESLGEVKVVVNGTAYAMTYDEATERFVYSLEIAESGDYAYYYEVNGEKVLDKFNPLTTEDKEASLVSYRKIDSVKMKATLSKEKVSYRENTVVSLAFSGQDANLVKESLTDITIDLSSLGLDSLKVDPKLLAATIAVTRETKAGKKTLPVTATDVYGNVYKSQVSLQVVKASTSSKDFDWDQAVIYMTCTDRFFDGNSTNNVGVDKAGSLSRHGGDFAGLTSKLDYLKDLGVNTIWITPIVENASNVTAEKDGETIESTGFCGYWATDFTKLDAHLGTEAEFEKLITEAHKRGMKLMVDVVLNHSGYTEAEVFDAEDTFNHIIVNDETGEYIPMLRDASNTISGDDVYASLAGLPDFVTENPEVRDQIVEWQVNWMDRFDIDYYRVDTVKHVNADVWKAFKNELTKVNPEFKMIGEYAGEGFANTAGSLGSGQMDSLLDFDFNDQALSFVSGNLSAVESFLKTRNESINNTATLGAFLSSHDENSLVDKIMETGVAEDKALDLFRVAVTLQLTAKGQAVIYYGEEIGQHGLDNYPYQTNRYDFDWDAATAQKSDANSMLNHYKKLLAIRASHKDLLASGSRVLLTVNEEAGVEAMKRSYDGRDLYVAMNISETAQAVTFAVNAKADTTMKDLYSGKTYKVAKDGTVTVTVPEAAKGGTVILEKLVETVVDEIIDKIPDPIKPIVKPIIKPIVDIFTGNSSENVNKTPANMNGTGTVVVGTSEGQTANNGQNTADVAKAEDTTKREEAAKSEEKAGDKVNDKNDDKVGDKSEDKTTDTILEDEAPKASNENNNSFPLWGILIGLVAIALCGGFAVYYRKKARK